MNALLIFPPQWHPATPYLSVPLLVAQLESIGVKAEGWDLNVEFYNDILNVENIQKSVEKIKNELDNAQINYDKYNKINKLLNFQSYKIKQTILYIEDAKKILKSDDFYNPVLFLKAKKIINYALEIISLPFYPTTLSLSDFNNKDMSYTYNSVTEYCNSPLKNIFYSYIKRRLIQKNINNYDYIGISIAHTNQLLASFTLGKLIKSMTTAHVSFGGNLVTRIKDVALENSDIFGEYLDSISIGNGENSIKQIVKAIENNQGFNEVDGLIYKNSRDEICINPISNYSSISSISEPSFTGYDLSKYFIPEIIIPLQLSKGCYWSKCTFCDFYYGRGCFTSDTVENIINKIKRLKKKYNISKFEFVDVAIHPTFYEKLANEILKNNLDISFYSMVRVEDEFSKKILKKLKKAGLKMLLWGVESASAKVLDLMQKGITIEKTKKILNLSAKEKIWNHTYFILGFPKETLKDAKQTIDFILKNNPIIDSYSAQPFTLNRYCHITENPERYLIYDIQEIEEFLPYYNFKSNITSAETTQSLLSYLHNKYIKKNKLILWKILTPDEYLFLYIIKYGKDKVKKYNFNFKKAHIPKLFS